MIVSRCNPSIIIRERLFLEIRYFKCPPTSNFTFALSCRLWNSPLLGFNEYYAAEGGSFTRNPSIEEDNVSAYQGSKRDRGVYFDSNNNPSLQVTNYVKNNLEA